MSAYLGGPKSARLHSDRGRFVRSISVNGGNIHFLRNRTPMVFRIMGAWGQEHFVVMHFFVGDDAQEVMHAV